MSEERATSTATGRTDRRASTTARLVLALGLVLVAGALVVTALETTSSPLPGPVEVASGVDPGAPDTGEPRRVEPLGPRVLVPDQPDQLASTDLATAEPSPQPPSTGRSATVTPPAPSGPGPVAPPDPGELLDDPTALLDSLTSPGTTLLPPLLDPEELLVVPLPGPDLTIPLVPGADPELDAPGDLLPTR